MTDDVSPKEVVLTDSVESLSQREQRSLVFHLLYTAEAFDYDTSFEAVVDGFMRGFSLNIPSDGTVYKRAQEIVAKRDELDKIYIPYLMNWRFERVGICTRLILRLATWELTATETDPAVIINEAIELAKCFAEKDAYKFVNGVLDQLNKQLHNNSEVKEIKSEE
jgi:N utilization substance protein B